MPNRDQFKSIRKEYQAGSLNEENLPIEPIGLFQLWLKEAIEVGVVEPNAFALATCNNNFPSARFVLLKDIGPSGLTFFTNYESRKGQELFQNANCAGTFYWKELERQVRFEGQATKLSDTLSDDYFATRPREAQIGVHISNQSQAISSREFLEENYKLKETFFAENTIPRPRHWGGYLIKPSILEFWQGRVGRLHDRIRYTYLNESWKKERLAP